MIGILLLVSMLALLVVALVCAAGAMYFAGDELWRRSVRNRPPTNPPHSAKTWRPPTQRWRQYLHSRDPRADAIALAQFSALLLVVVAVLASLQAAPRVVPTPAPSPIAWSSVVPAPPTPAAATGTAG